MTGLMTGKREITYVGIGGVERSAIIDVPSLASREPVPLILGTHPAGWTNAEDFHGGAFDTVAPHPGWHGLAEKHGVIIVSPQTYGENVPLLSLGYRPSMQDAVGAIDAVRDLGYRIDHDRIYACGLSMGGQETLLLIARNPGLFAAGFAFNPVIDVRAWYNDILSSPYYAELNGDDPSLALDHLIQQELGGPADSQLSACAERSPQSYATQLTTTPLMIYWSQLDDIVPHQATRQTLALVEEIRRIDPNAPVAAFNHTWSHGYSLFDLRERWALHEYSDYDLAASWLLTNRKRPIA
jgi:predicted peptidase